jgi:WD40 repeat protein
MLDGQPMPVADIDVSPDGSRIAAVLPNGQIRLFDVLTGELQLVLDPGDGRFLARVAFSPDGSMLASQSVGLVRVWALDIDEALSIARDRVTRGLRDDECRRFRLEATPGCTGADDRS